MFAASSYVGITTVVRTTAQPTISPVPPTRDERPLSALPSPVARALAFAAILVGGLAGGLIGYALVDLQCEGDCALGLGLGTLAGAVAAAGGTAVVAVLVLRAIGEWTEIQDRQ